MGPPTSTGKSGVVKLPRIRVLVGIYLMIGVGFWQGMAFWALRFKPGGHYGPDPYGLPTALSAILFWPLWCWGLLMGLVRHALTGR